LNGHINVGDAITISVEPHLLALARGYVLKLTTTSILIGVDHDLSPHSVKAKLSLTTGRQDDGDELIFRIDRDELFGGMGRMRNNLAHLFYVDDEDGRNRRLRELLVDLKAPLFHNDVPPQVKKLLRKLIVEARPAAEPQSTSQAEKKEPVALGLNQAQTDALRKIISAQDYALVLGMPGTGKTTVIAALICLLVQLGKTVLLTSYTHSAVDNILLKLDSMNNINSNTEGSYHFGVLRLGNVDKVNFNTHRDVYFCNWFRRRCTHKSGNTRSLRARAPKRSSNWKDS
jgi:DNA replication ATP-dependent helicase Dna2